MAFVQAIDCVEVVVRMCNCGGNGDGGSGLLQFATKDRRNTAGADATYDR